MGKRPGSRARIFGSLTALLAAFCLLIAGCGGGGGGSASSGSAAAGGTSSTTLASTQSNTGTVAITVTRSSARSVSATRDVPSGTSSVSAAVLGTPIVQTVPFPPGESSVTLTLTGLPVGSQTILIKALGTGGVPLASATVQVDVVAGESTEAEPVVLTPTASPAPSASEAPTPQPGGFNALYVAVAPQGPASTPSGIMQFNIDMLPSPPVMTAFPANFTAISLRVARGNGVPYLFVFGSQDPAVGVLTYELLVYSLNLTSTTLTPTLAGPPIPLLAFPGTASPPSDNSMRCDPVHNVLYIPGFNATNAIVDIVDVSAYTPSTTSLSEDTLVVTGTEYPVVAIDTSPAPTFFLESTQDELFSLPLSNPSPPGQTILPLDDLGAVDLSYANGPVGVIEGGSGQLIGFNPTENTTPGASQMAPLPSEGGVDDVHFARPSFGTSAAGSSGLVSGITDDSGPLICGFGILAGTYNTSVSDSVSLPAGDFPNFIAISNNTNGQSSQGFVSDEETGTIYVVNLNGANMPTLLNSLSVGAARVPSLTVFQSSGPNYTR